MSNSAWAQRDLAHVWHPCTQMKDHESLPLIPIRRGDGVWLEDFDGNRYLDAVSSWWVNLFGHANPRITDAIFAQSEQLEQVILGGFTHEPVIRLSEKLVDISPPGLNKVFYADNGSSAVEVALKMSFHYWLNTGKPQKQRFINVSNSYHGETLGALAVGDVSLYKDTYGPLMMDVITAPGPDCYFREEGESWADYNRRQFVEVERVIEQHAHEAAAVILEPLVQCAGNMRMHDPIFLSLLRDACNRHQVHLIFDEIAVGFGRTGTLFAAEQAGVTPDFMCLSKGLTGGYLPLSAVLTTDQVFDAFYDEYENLTAFLHSHSFTGNPMGCAAALATLDIFETDNVIENNKALIAKLAECVAPLADHPNVAEVRQTGMICAVEMTPDGTRNSEYPWQERRGLTVFKHGLQNGMLLRPLGSVTYFMPPYVITPEEIEQMVGVAAAGIDLATRD